MLGVIHGVLTEQSMKVDTAELRTGFCILNVLHSMMIEACQKMGIQLNVRALSSRGLIFHFNSHFFLFLNSIATVTLPYHSCCRHVMDVFIATQTYIHLSICT